MKQLNAHNLHSSPVDTFGSAGRSARMRDLRLIDCPKRSINLQFPPNGCRRVNVLGKDFLPKLAMFVHLKLALKIIGWKPIPLKARKINRFKAAP